MRILKSLLLALGVIGLIAAAGPAYAKDGKAKGKGKAGVSAKKDAKGKKAKGKKGKKGKTEPGEDAAAEGKTKGKGKAKGKDGDHPGKALGKADEKPGKGLGRDKTAKEERKHMMRVAKLERIATLATASEKADLAKRATELLTKEKARYIQALSKLKEAASAEEAAEPAAEGEAP